MVLGWITCKGNVDVRAFLVKRNVMPTGNSLSIHNICITGNVFASLGHNANPVFTIHYVIWLKILVLTVVILLLFPCVGSLSIWHRSWSLHARGWFKVLNSSKSGVYNAERHIRDYKVLRTLHFEEIAEEAVTPWFDSVSQRAPQFGRDNSKWRTFGKWNFIFEKETAPNGIMSDTNSHTRRSYTSQKWTSFIGKNMNLEKNIRYYLRLFVVLSCTMKIWIVHIVNAINVSHNDNFQ